MANKLKDKKTEETEIKPEINEVMNDIDSEIENKNLELETLKKENEELNKIKEELENKVKYTQAEMINYRKRKDEEVLEVLLKGYMLKDRVIRPATVKINKIDE